MFGKKTSRRRNTIRSIAIEEDDDDVEETGGRKNMTNQGEDILIAEILPKMDVIEKKSTDRSLNPKNVAKLQTEAWNEILASFNSKTKVDIDEPN